MRTAWLAALLLSACSTITGYLGSTPPPAPPPPPAPKVVKPKVHPGLIACYQAEALYRARMEPAPPKKPKDRKGGRELVIKELRFWGYRKLSGVVPCPSEVTSEPLPEPLHAAAQVMTVKRLDSFDLVEQDTLKNQDLAYLPYRYQVFDVTYAEKLDKDGLTPLPASAWSAEQARGVSTPEKDVLVGSSKKFKFDMRFTDLGEDLRPVWLRFYSRRNLAARPAQDEMTPAEQKIWSCFENLAAKDYCSAESDGDLATQADASLAEGPFCSAYGHLRHNPRGGCHTTGNVNSPLGKCIFSCLDLEEKCVDKGLPAGQCDADSLKCQDSCK